MRRIAVLLAVSVTAFAAPATDPAGDPPDLYIAPYLQNVTPDGITVMWETTEPVVGTVEFGEAGSFRGRATEPEPRTIHEVHIAGLEASTKYDYRVRYADRILAPASFTTAPHLARPITASSCTATTGRTPVRTPATSGKSWRSGLRSS